MIARILNRLAARRLGRRSHVNEHARMVERTRQMRRELGLPDDRRLA